MWTIDQVTNAEVMSSGGVLSIHFSCLYFTCVFPFPATLYIFTTFHCIYLTAEVLHSLRFYTQNIQQV